VGNRAPLPSHDLDPDRVPHTTTSSHQTRLDGKSSTGIYAHLADGPIGFEQFAAHLWQMADGHVGTYAVTRAAADGGRDAVGGYLTALRCRVRAPA